MGSWKRFFLNNIYVFLFIGLVILFFYPFVFLGKIPIPADTIVGMYHPWRDVVWDDYTSGVPFKNFLITDPVRQQYVWRKLAIEQLKKGNLPLWNPYSFSGAPLLANFQSAVFYPLNILFFFLPFNLSWGILILFSPLLAGIFLYFYLRHFHLSKLACLFGSLVFSFSGFFVAWLEWGTILHVALWLPLILLSIEKILTSNLTKNKIIWSLIFVFASTSQFLAGHLQTSFYLTLMVLFYIMARLVHFKLVKNSILPSIILFSSLGVLIILLTSIQWLPTFRFINLSAREFDLPNWRHTSWFLPSQHLIQFLAPDFFGNPVTLNYWEEWNYAEFLGYIGILPLILALAAMLWRRDKKTWVFTTVVFVSLIFALPTPLAKLPYKWQIPLISTIQPTRLLFLTDFSLSVLAALGFDWFLKNLNDLNHLKKILGVILLFGMIFSLPWLFVLIGQTWFKSVTAENLSIAKRNLLLPTGLFIISFFLLLLPRLTRRKICSALMIYIIVSVTAFDLFRFGWKFTPFTKEEWLFPQTETVRFLKSKPRLFRLMTTDRRIFPPNFATFYQLEDVSGYDPLYLRSYGELVAAWDRKNPDINPFSFNRILTPQDYSSRIADLLNVKYVLTLKDEHSPKLKLVFQEGETRVYENNYVYPRAFLVYDYKIAKNRQEAINFLFDESVDLQKTAILEEDPKLILEGEDKEGEVKIESYEAPKIVIKAKSRKPAILIFADNFYPGWQAFLDGKAESEKTFRADFTLRGIIVPEGEHKIEFYPSL